MPLAARAAWLAQELLTTFETELTELALTPGTGGVFVVRVDDEVVWTVVSRVSPSHGGEELVRDRWPGQAPGPLGEAGE